VAAASVHDQQQRQWRQRLCMISSSDSVCQAAHLCGAVDEINGSKMGARAGSTERADEGRLGSIGGARCRW
jgi:hypothetical protein